MRFLLCFFLLLPASVSPAMGQITKLDDTTSTPMPGIGHDYIHLLSETVNPTNGSINVNAVASPPAGRGVSLPFSFVYNSNGVHYLQASPPPFWGTAQWNRSMDYLSQGGWSYSVPRASSTQWTSTFSTAGGLYAVCSYSTNYIFKDASGGLHSLPVGDSSFGGNASPQTCTPSLDRILTGSDSQVSATLSCNGCSSANDSLVVADRDGTTYVFGAAAKLGSLPALIEDRNGNEIHISDALNGNFTFTDTAGRSTITSSGFGPSGATNTVTVAGLTYSATWKTTTSNFLVSSTAINAGSNSGCTSPGTESDSQTVLSTLTLPNGEGYTFYYGTDNPDPSLQNPYGLLSEIIYPSGAWVKYTWKLSDTMSEFLYYPYGSVNCLYQYKMPVVGTRQVGANGGSSATLIQSFTYATNWTLAGTSWTTKQTKVTTNDVVRGTSNLTVYTYGSVPALGSIFEPTPPFPLQTPVEQSIAYYNSADTSQLLKTVTKQWYDAFNLESVQTTSNTGSSSRVVYCYVGTNCAPQGGISQLAETDEYDYGQTVPTRKTLASYQGFPVTTATLAGVPVQLGSIKDKVCKNVVDDGNNVRLAETDYYYDGNAGLCASSPGLPTSVVSGLPVNTHDESNFGPSSTLARGNLTATVKWANAGVSPKTTYTYDETGQPLSMTEPCGNAACSDMSGTNHTTTYSYVDSPSGANPAGNSNAYLTHISYPTTSNGAAHQEARSYNYVAGDLITVTDENNNTTTYKYNTPPAGCGFADGLGRLSEVDYPDGGQKTYCYQDGPHSPGVSVPNLTTSELICTTQTPYSGCASNQVKTSTAYYDGIGQTIQTALADPAGADLVDTIYDGLGRLKSMSNPYRLTTDPTYGTILYAYDALGRPTIQTQQDGSVLQWCYDGIGFAGQSNCLANRSTQTTGSWVDYSDETGRHWQRVSDALGRLTSVMEPDGSQTLSAPPSVETDYHYDVLGNLTRVDQWGGASGSTGDRVRTFSYDSLSQLLCSANPEVHLATCPNPDSGTYTAFTTRYSYDGNGNLATKIAPAPNVAASNTTTATTTNSYDALNRLTQSTHSDGSPTETFQYDTSTYAGTNLIGHLTTASTSSGSTTLAERHFQNFDAMGRVTYERSCTYGLCGAKAHDIYYGYDLAGNMTYQTNGVASKVISLYYAYNTVGELAGITSSLNDSTHPPHLFSNASYSPLGGLLYAKYGYDSSTGQSSVNVWRTYDNRGRITSENSKSGMTGGAYLYSYTIPAAGYASNGNLLSINDWTVGQWTYGYDNVNRLTSATAVGGTYVGQSILNQNLAWTYDPFGNRTAQTSNGSLFPTSWAHFTTADNHESATNSAPGGPVYDAAGELLNDGINNYQWDSEGRVCDVVQGTTQTKYILDAEGRRVAKAHGTCALGFTTYADLVYNQSGQQISEADGLGNWLHTNVYANGQLFATYQGSTTTFLLNDWLGTKRVAVSPAGVRVTSYASLPFGDDLIVSGGTDPSEVHYTGKERDAESGNDYFGARYYASSMGRFMSPDPAGVAFTSLSNPQSWNLYSYVQNNPLNSVDPDGRECVWDDGSFDSATDEHTGSTGGCAAAGGTYYEPSTFTAGNGQDWSSAPNADLAAQVAESQAFAASLPDPGTAIGSSTSTSGSTTTINLFGPNWQSTQVSTGNHPFRDNNPGDIISGRFVNNHGAIGTDGRFGVFPTAGTGSNALDSLLRSPTYSSKSISDAISTYAPAFENNTAGYQQFLTNALGVSGNTPLSSLSSGQMQTLENAISRYEGYDARGNFSVTTTSVITPP